ncbi:hypothetical protein [Alteromonas halophila]|uniref:hypothetical protein n=1 Tax=Alteromonas halophila TaxID=516698 RepID=UPI001676CABF|nr:hypothetical protein [Alteromonas halophila]
MEECVEWWVVLDYFVTFGDFALRAALKRVQNRFAVLSNSFAGSHPARASLVLLTGI